MNSSAEVLWRYVSAAVTFRTSIEYEWRLRKKSQFLSVSYLAIPFYLTQKLITGS
jgi:head-tail adaptor